MSRVLKEQVFTARKDYPCAACENLIASNFINELDDYDVTLADKRALVKIRREGYKVLKGTKYLYQVGIYDGFYAIQCRLDAAAIVDKYHLNEE